MLVPIESLYDFLLVNNTNSLTYILSCTVSKLLQIIGQIFACDRGVPLFNTLGVNPETQEHEIWHQEPRNITLSYGVKCILIT